MARSNSLVINDWIIYAHPLFLEQLEALISQVGKAKLKTPENYKKKNSAKRLAAIYQFAFQIIPEDPTLSKYRQGHTLGEDNKHWFRAKFFQQYRLFFRFHFQSKIIVYAWINDEKTKRAYESKSDAYLVFGKMLKQGTPPNDWDELLREAKLEKSRLGKIVK